MGEAVAQLGGREVSRAEALEVAVFAADNAITVFDKRISLQISAEAPYPERILPRLASLVGDRVSELLSPEQIETLRSYALQEENKVLEERRRRTLAILQARELALSESSEDTDSDIEILMRSIRSAVTKMRLRRKAESALFRALETPEKTLDALRTHLGHRLREVISEEDEAILELRRKIALRDIAANRSHFEAIPESSQSPDEEVTIDSLLEKVETITDEADEVFARELDIEDNFDDAFAVNRVLAMAVAFAKENQMYMTDLLECSAQSSVRKFFSLLRILSKGSSDLGEVGDQLLKSGKPDAYKVLTALHKSYGKPVGMSEVSAACTNMKPSTALTHVKIALDAYEWAAVSNENMALLLFTDIDADDYGDHSTRLEIPGLKPFVTRDFSKIAAQSAGKASAKAELVRTDALRRSVVGEELERPAWIPDRDSLLDAAKRVKNLEPEQVGELRGAVVGWISKLTTTHSRRNTQAFSAATRDELLEGLSKLRNKSTELDDLRALLSARKAILKGVFMDNLVFTLNSLPANTALKTAYKVLHTLQEAQDYEGERAPLIHTPPPLTIAQLAAAVESGQLPEDLWRNQGEIMGASSRGLHAGYTRMLIDSPPGTGKTRIIAELIKSLNLHGRSLVLCPTIDLCNQTYRTLQNIFGDDMVGLVTTDAAIDFEKPITVSTYSSCQSGILNRNGSTFHPKDYGLVFFDEAHRTLSAQRQLISSTFDHSILFTLSGSTKGIGGKHDLADKYELTYRMGLRDGMQAELINPIRFWIEDVPTALSEKIEKAFSFFEDECDSEPTLIITRTTDEADKVVRGFQSRGVEARTVHTKIDCYHALLSLIEGGFRHGEFPVLVVCKMLTEGWDMPPLANQIIMHVPGVPWLIEQWAGRVSRVMEGKGDSRSLLMMTPQVEAPHRNAQMAIRYALGIDTEDWTNGERLVEPVPGWWPENPCKV